MQIQLVESLEAGGDGLVTSARLLLVPADVSAVLRSAPLSLPLPIYGTIFGFLFIFFFIICPNWKMNFVERFRVIKISTVFRFMNRNYHRFLVWIRWDWILTPPSFHLPPLFRFSALNRRKWSFDENITIWTLLKLLSFMCESVQNKNQSNIWRWFAAIWSTPPTSSRSSTRAFHIYRRIFQKPDHKSIFWKMNFVELTLGPTLMQKKTGIEC